MKTHRKWNDGCWSDSRALQQPWIVQAHQILNSTVGWKERKKYKPIKNDFPAEFLSSVSYYLRNFLRNTNENFPGNIHKIIIMKEWENRYSDVRKKESKLWVFSFWSCEKIKQKKREWKVITRWKFVDGWCHKFDA